MAEPTWLPACTTGGSRHPEAEAVPAGSDEAAASVGHLPGSAALRIVPAHVHTHLRLRSSMLFSLLISCEQKEKIGEY